MAIHTSNLTRAVKKIKLPKEENNLKIEQNGEAEKILKMSSKEFKILNQLDHPYIMRLIDGYKDNENFEIVTEFCEGKDLFECIKDNGKIGEKDSAFIIKQLLQSLNYCHEKNICHRDIKVENLVVDQ